jgi:hypothetical protein
MILVNTLADLAIKYFSERNFKLFIKALLTLKEEVIKLDPESLDDGMVDLVMDEALFDWALESYNKEPSDYDWQAATVVYADLQFILN